MKNILAVGFIILAASPAFGAEDILSVDGSLLIQIALFVALLVILKKGLFQPMIDLLDKREKLTTGTIQEAKRLNDEVERIVRDYDLKINQARTQALEERGAIRREAQAAADDVTGRARRESQSLLEKARAELELETAKIKERMKPEIEAIARDVASKILGKEVKN